MAIYGIYKPKYHAREKIRQNAMPLLKPEAGNPEIRRNTVEQLQEPNFKSQTKPQVLNPKSEGNTDGKHQETKKQEPNRPPADRSVVAAILNFKAQISDLMVMMLVFFL